MHLTNIAFIPATIIFLIYLSLAGLSIYALILFIKALRIYIRKNS
ncbi:hypothetical protein CLPU_16c00090 [Gottschalkia purinilytica]|uniref:Uncharacterized protein n=1 Tax=Gottschalkia purinilytica TaxID=1503 RepID=A0A0L0W7P7_GOTPU|nr:hypothetical protein [Gottschalkia purinilytica]KNF07456.1 hypothetical protein CLPU_16c00090 [Gottschalkia purinilytica]